VNKIELDYSKISDIVLDQVDLEDFPKFTDAYILSASYMGREMTEDELEILNEDRDFVHRKVIERL
jgi:hypothetical protein